jgi:DNA-binding NarL/FixJ family response regulator
LSLYREQADDVVLCDLFLPDQTGVETLRQLRAEFPNAKVVLLAPPGTDSLQALADAAPLGALATLGKPVSPDFLTLTLNALLGRRE